MRITSVFVLFALLIPALASCGQNTELYTTGDAQALLDAGVFDGDMVKVENFPSALYGIESKSVADCVSFRAANTAASYDEVTVLILNDVGTAENVVKALREIVESEIENAKSYCPSAVPHLQAAVIDRIGNTVLFAVGDPDALPDAVGNLHK